MYYRNAQAALVVYDLTKPTSLVKAKHWVAELQRQASPGIVIALVGNKLDLCAEASDSLSETSTLAPSESADSEATEVEDAEGAETGDARKVPTREAKAYAEEESLLFFETSAKLGTNVSEVFTAIANAIPEKELKPSKTAGAGRGTDSAISNAAGSAGQATVNLADRAKQQKDNCAC